MLMTRGKWAVRCAWLQPVSLLMRERSVGKSHAVRTPSPVSVNVATSCCHISFSESIRPIMFA